MEKVLLKKVKILKLIIVFFNLRYPFWHDYNLEIINSEMTPNCRAALWYSNHITITNSKLHGIKALRECSDIKIKDVILSLLNLAGLLIKSIWKILQQSANILCYVQKI